MPGATPIEDIPGESPSSYGMNDQDILSNIVDSVCPDAYYSDENEENEYESLSDSFYDEPGPRIARKRRLRETSSFSFENVIIAIIVVACAYILLKDRIGEFSREKIAMNVLTLVGVYFVLKKFDALPFRL